jgi:tagaturonate reductase
MPTPTLVTGDKMQETVLQFGGGQFLRAFVDLFIDQANAAGDDVGKIVVVQSTESPRADLFNTQQGHYHVLVRGLVSGCEVDEVLEAGSVSRALVASKQWAEVLEVARSSALLYIVSNVTEAGYELEDGDTIGEPRSFPAKVVAALHARFVEGGTGLCLLPCELLDNNGDRLHKLVLEQVARWNLGSDFAEWLGHECIWVNSLVDRIVSRPPQGHPLAERDGLLAVAEPFALWAIEKQPGLNLFVHPAIEMVEAVEPYSLRKVRILNGAHTGLVCKALPQGFVTVREALADADIRAWLETLLFEEIVPIVAEQVEGAGYFAQQVLERLANPFLDHRLEDIALYHDIKIGTRLLPTYEDYVARRKEKPALLAEIMAPYL